MEKLLCVAKKNEKGEIVTVGRVPKVQADALVKSENFCYIAKSTYKRIMQIENMPKFNAYNPPLYGKKKKPKMRLFNNRGNTKGRRISYVETEHKVEISERIIPRIKKMWIEIKTHLIENLTVRRKITDVKYNEHPDYLISPATTTTFITTRKFKNESNNDVLLNRIIKEEAKGNRESFRKQIRSNLKKK